MAFRVFRRLRDLLDVDTTGAVEGDALVLDADGVTWVPGAGGGGGADDQTAAEVPFTPAGSVAATDVQSAIAELDTEKQPVDSDLTAIAALTTTSFGRGLLELANQAALLSSAGAAAASHAHAGEDITSGTVADARIASTIARDSEVTSAVAALSSVYQPLDSDLTAIAALTTTSYGRAFLALADAAAGRTALGLGSLATQSGTFSGTSSGTNTGDQTTVSGNAGTATALATARNIDGQAFDGTAAITVIAPGTHAATGKTTPVDADEIPLVDSAASNVLKKVTWANVKATLKTYFDTLYAPVGGSGGALVLLEQHSASASATLDFTSFISSTYDEYVIEAISIVPATTNTNLLMRMGTGGGPTWDSGTNYGWAGWRWAPGGSAAAGATTAQNQIVLDANGGIKSDPALPFNGSWRLFAPQSTAACKYVMGQAAYLDNSSTLIGTTLTGLWAVSGTAMTGLRFLMAAGNITSGTIRIYGVAK